MKTKLSCTHSPSCTVPTVIKLFLKINRHLVFILYDFVLIIYNWMTLLPLLIHVFSFLRVFLCYIDSIPKIMQLPPFWLKWKNSETCLVRVTHRSLFVSPGRRFSSGLWLPAAGCTVCALHWDTFVTLCFIIQARTSLRGNDRLWKLHQSKCELRLPKSSETPPGSGLFDSCAWDRIASPFSAFLFVFLWSALRGPLRTVRERGLPILHCGLPWARIRDRKSFSVRILKTFLYAF